MNEPYILIVGRERRRPGRPRVDEPMAALSTWIPASLHDSYIKTASDRDESISQLVKQALVIALPIIQKPK